MYILSRKIKERFNISSNLEFMNSDNNIRKNHLKKGQLKHTPSSVKEWCNSIYHLERNTYVKNLPIKDNLLYKMFDTYFNLNKLKEYNDLSISKIFIGRPEVKHFNNKIHITLYIFDK
jgi:hypothetical protein